MGVQMKKVLMIDDEGYIENVANMFKRHGLDVYLAPTGEEGLGLYTEHKPDCVLLDINLPGMDGIETFYKLKEIDDNVKVYFITGEVGSIALNNALDDGAKDYLLKPIDVTRLQEIISEVQEDKNSQLDFAG